MRLSELNGLDLQDCIARLSTIFEHSPWVAESAAGRRPFGSVDALHAAMMQATRAAPSEAQLALIRAHPELAGREAAAGTLTAESTSEQARLGFNALSRAEFERVARINQAYREKFGFPCIVALKLHDSRATVIDEMENRAGNTREAEMAAALEQIGHITRGRLAQLVRED
jgi:2-oxo-4-hydroxy-4-carboxy-5-ureidoimidazoline decarboxylase